MSSTFNLPFALLAAVILLPLIPAFIIFKLLPASADVSGPLQGFEIKLGGAFGAYFALVVLVLFTKNGIWDPAPPPPPPPAYQVWTVSGTIDDNTGTPLLSLAPGDVTLLPPSLTQQPGWFSIDIPVKPGQNGSTDYPTLEITPKGYVPQDVSLDPASPPPPGVTFDDAAHTVKINGLRLQPQPTATYNAAVPLNPAAPVVKNPPSGGGQ